MADSSTTTLRTEPTPPAENAPTSPSSTGDSSSSSSAVNGTPSSSAGDSTDKPAAGTEVKNDDPAAAASSSNDQPLPNGKPGPKKRYCSHRKQAMMEAEKEAKEKAEKEKAEAEKNKAEAEKNEKEKEKEKEKADAEKEKKDKEEAEKAKAESSSDGKKKKRRKSASKKKRRSKRKSEDTDSDSESDASAASDSSSSSGSSSSDSSDESDADTELLRAVLKVMLKSKAKAKKSKKKRKAKRKAKKAAEEAAAEEAEASESAEGENEEEEEKKDEPPEGAVEFKRVDELYDKELHDWTIKDTVPNPKIDSYSGYVFTVRRCFDYEGRHIDTVLDIKSPLLKDALHDVMGHIRGISLVEDIPVIDPKTIFLYEEQLKAWLEADHSDRKGKKPRRDPLTSQPLPEFTEEERKTQKEEVKLLLSYIDTDYKATRAQLYPLLENKSITYDLLWAVLKPETIMYTTCAGSNEPRAFRLEYAQENSSFTRGKWWSVEGRYLEFEGTDGELDAPKSPNAGFGWGTVMVDIEHFKGPKKIQSLACYPMEMRKDKEELREKLIERGKKFVELRGQKYKMHNGLAFLKKNRQYLKVHVNGRVMIDSATFRRVNPNYVLSSVKSRNNDAEDDEEANYFYLNPEDDPDNDSTCGDCCCSDEDKAAENADRDLKKMRWIKDDAGEWHLVTKEEVLAGQNKLDNNIETLNPESDEDNPDADPVFEEDDYLLAAPVVLGWAFTEKLWLEFPVSQISEIVWNEKAFDHLVLPADQKEIVRALVESHSATSGSNTIDDVIAGKGRGLVSVLHGPPGVGKTMTCEAIAEFLQRPLYSVSSGELGTNPTQLEHELQKILEIAHGWGAVLLLDEADVFLEKRSFADMHRNALVSIFLRLLEYFQGILFLTTNRVETFDDAFQSRIHVALRYGDLKLDAKTSIWKMFLDKVHAAELASSAPTPASSTDSSPSSPVTLPRLVTLSDIEWLSKKDLNGRQIKNIVRTAQALAKSKGERMGMKHVRQVLAVAEGFENDLKGTGRLDNMHAYA